ncbi:universal stress protein [Natronorubrum aibiense]|uniref:UspA domain-containing protein n=1 Tax=Natronorubrum aibiense TaxID=348826 RepID=A0A5P9P8W1_9EURY|nr:universal stress protein [Natronorubrum aibiense]QFU84591.1 hypothetical protein GCU68_18810 [Natronorubrum aibiense]
MYDRVLVQVDTDDRTHPAVGYAVDVAATHGASLYVLEPVETSTHRVVRIERDVVATAQSTDRASSTDEHTLLETTGEVVSEFPNRTETTRQSTLARCVASHEIDLTVVGVGRRRRLGASVFGSSVTQRLTTASTPVITVRADAEITRSPPFESVLVLVDQRGDGLEQVTRGAELAARDGANVHLLAVVTASVLGTSVWSRDVVDQLEATAHGVIDDAAAVAASEGVDEVVTTVVSGTVISELQSHVAMTDADLIVSRTGLPDGLTERIVRTAPVPVLNVHLE